MNRQRSMYNDFAIIDGLLSEEHFQCISSEIHSLAFQQTTSGKSIWDSIESENPKQSITTFAWPSEPIAALLNEQVRASLAASSLITLYPTNTPLDEALKAIKREAVEARQLLGEEGTNWTDIIGRAFQYAAGTRAIWHTDDHSYYGAFIYYVHTRWEANWGGELLIEHRTTGVGDGAYVSPIPNRLVLLRRGVKHSVTRVSGLASGNSRTSLTGFFVTQSFTNMLPGDRKKSGENG